MKKAGGCALMLIALPLIGWGVFTWVIWPNMTSVTPDGEILEHYMTWWGKALGWIAFFGGMGLGYLGVKLWAGEREQR